MYLEENKEINDCWETLQSGSELQSGSQIESDFGLQMPSETDKEQSSLQYKLFSPGSHLLSGIQ